MSEAISVELAAGHSFDVGCYLEGARGWRNSGHLVELAANLSKQLGDGGFVLSADDRRIVNAFLNGALVQLKTVDGHIDVFDHVVDLADTALDYLNSLAVAAAERGGPECSWQWVDGELFFQHTDWYGDARDA
jgi:hypothetical protein